MSAERKEFTEAERGELEIYIRIRNQAEADVQRFVAFLRRQHGVDETWEANVNGFTKPDEPEKT